MSALAVGVAVAPPVLPVAHRTVCPGCGAIVLEVPLRDGELTIFVEPQEFLLRMRCPACLSARMRHPERYRRKRRTLVAEETYFTRDVLCWRCGAAPGEEGWVGEYPTGFGAALGEEGLARPLDLSRIPTTRTPNGSLDFVVRTGEAIHRAHACRSVRALL